MLARSNIVYEGLVVLQAIQVAILWLHDWIPLGRLNNVRAVQAQDTRARLIRVTIIQSLPYTIGLIYSAAHLGSAYPGWLRYWLWISYGLLFAGEIRAWWWPYLIRPDSERALRYNTMFGGTHAFLPMHNGMVPNTLHSTLHAATAATLIMLLCLATQGT